MKRHKFLVAMIAASALAACGDWNRSGDPGKLRIEPPSSRVLVACDRPVPIPATAKTQMAQETLWRRDRLAPADCADKHAIAVEWIEGVTAEFQPRN